MTIVRMILGIGLFIVGLLVTVGLHELGHLLPAKKFGVKVPKYFIGFGRTLWSVTRGGTEWGIKAIPLGGFVQLAGMLAPAKPGTRVTKRNGSGELTLAEEARRQSAAELAPGESVHAFWRLPAHRKLIVMCGGPFVNLLLSVLLMITVLCGIGGGVYGTTLAQVQMCADGSTSCANSPAEQLPGYAAGLQAGDKILSWAGKEVTDWPAVQSAIAAGGAAPVRVQVQRGQQILSLTITPRQEPRPMIRDGAVVTDPATGEARTELKAFVGIMPQLELRRQSLSAALAQTGKLAVGTAQIVAVLPMKLWQTGVALFTGTPRDTNSVVGIVGVAQMAGNITSAQLAGYGLAQRAADFLLLMAALNMSLFVFNMIPLLPLDGGHILGAVIEGIRRSWWRLRGAERSGRPDPGAFDTARLLPLSYAVIAFFVFMTILLIVADVVNPVV